MTTGLYFLSCVELSIFISGLDLLTIGLDLDMWTEMAIEDVSLDRIATQVVKYDKLQGFKLIHNPTPILLILYV